MTYPRIKRNPTAGSNQHTNSVRIASTQLPRNWRKRLPDPASYYAQHVLKLGKPNADGNASAKCPFHDDNNASLSVNVVDAGGPWCCFAGCGGGDLIAFHMRLRSLDFKAAVRELIGGSA